MFRRILPHICIVLSLTVLMLLILNVYNPFMGFLSSTVSLWFLLALCLAAFATAVVLIRTDRRSDR
ncbi:MAG: hypothetical protein IKS55_10650 [Oscillospiraceae bacterium]|nr:hypothetical protein [Oscillospiraceae bacterium]